MSKAFGSFAALRLAAAVSAAFAALSVSAADAPAAQAPAAHKMTPGEYTEVAISRNGPMEVKTKLSENRIEAIEVVKSVETSYISGDAIKSISEKIIKDQTLLVDTVSGATRASEALLRAVGQAVERAGGKTDDFMKTPEVKDPKTLPLADAETADVVVVGAGASGLAAAAAALEAGAKVVVLEKAPRAGGSAAVSDGIVAAAGTDIQKAAGLTTDPAGLAKTWLEDQKRSVKGAPKNLPDSARVEALVKSSADTVEWLTKNVGMRFSADAAAADGIGAYALAPLVADASEPAGADQIRRLENYVKKLGGTIRTSTSVWQILKDKDGRVSGAAASDGTNRFEFRARAVILASGGFGADLMKVTERQPRWSVFVEFSDVPKSNTGDGLALAQEAGAKEVPDSWIAGHGIESRYAALTPAMLGARGFAGITLVNEKGERFVKEDLPELSGPMSQQLETWAITDSSDPEKAKVLEKYVSFDTAVDGNTWEELARRMGVKAATLKKTMEDMNADAVKGRDSAFGRAPENFSPITKAPFYAVKVRPIISTTMGGIETDAHFAALDAAGKPVPGLWAVGEMANRAFYNRVYEPGTGLLIAFSSGRIAGSAAAKAALAK